MFSGELNSEFIFEHEQTIKNMRIRSEEFILEEVYNNHEEYLHAISASMATLIWLAIYFSPPIYEDNKFQQFMSLLFTYLLCEHLVSTNKLKRIGNEYKAIN